MRLVAAPPAAEPGSATRPDVLPLALPQPEPGERADLLDPAFVETERILAASRRYRLAVVRQASRRRVQVRRAELGPSRGEAPPGA